jgi:hypothetical protein
MPASVKRAGLLAGLAIVVALFPRSAAAQSTISGLVTDTSGALLPGVTVEASSPALIEKVRTTVTNADGRYTIVDLRPGIYAVTFALQGFSTVKRDEIRVESNVTVPLNVELRVGAVQETIVVTGATPMVDIQQAAQRQVLGREQLDALPTARSYLSTGVVVPSVKISRPDMGGIAVGQGSYLSARGRSSGDDSVEIDGLDVRISNGVSQSGYNNFGMVQDVTYQTSAIGADSAGGGVRINMIPREGGNTFHGDMFIGGSNGWQSSNLTPELVAGGLKTPDALKYLIDFNPSIGGPIVRDKLWLFGSGRFNEVQVAPAGAHYFATGEQGFTTNDLHNLSGRLTYQISPRNKFTAYIDKAFKSQDHTMTFTIGDGNAPGIDWATATSTYDPSNYQLGYFKWTSPVTSRFLLEAGYTFNVFNVVYNTEQPGTLKTPFTPEWYAGALRRDLVLNTFVGQPSFSENFARQPLSGFAGAASYVTGSHTFKAGLQYRHGYYENLLQGSNAHLIEQFRSGVPNSVVAYPLPVELQVHANELGVYGMDAWTLKRLTLNLGLRLDAFRGGVDPSTSGAGRFVGPRTVAASSPVPDFNDISPRLSAVYDLFGDAKTAVKFSASKYLTQLSSLQMLPYNPISSAGDTRLWSDTDVIPGTTTPSGRPLATNGDGIAQDNEIGPSGNSRFGKAPDRRADPNLKREYAWDYVTSIQHQVIPTVSVSAGWYFSRTYNSQGAVNVARSFSDYTPFQVQNPYHASEMITLFRLNPAKVGAVDTVTINSDVNYRDYQAFEASVNGRWARGGTLNFGWAMERNRIVSCDTPNPNQLRFCDQTGNLYQEYGKVPAAPYLHEFKLALGQQLPYGFLFGASVIDYPGIVLPVGGQPLPTPSLGVNWVVPASAYPAGLGQTEVLTVPLESPYAKWLDRWAQFDISIRRRFKFGRYEAQPALEIYNLFNSSVVLSRNQNYGPSLDAPLSTLQGRLFKLTAILRF